MGAARKRSADRCRLTNWLLGSACEPSGHAGGREISNRDWLELERGRVCARGHGCTVRENPDAPGYFALFRK